MLARAAQTNQWYSTLIFNAVPEAIFVQPLSVKPTARGLEVALPRKQVVPTERKDTEIHFPHRDALLLAPAAFEASPAKLANASDWSIEIAMGRGDDRFQVNVARGVPYAFVQLGRGDLRVKLPAAGERFDAGGDARVLALRRRPGLRAVRPHRRALGAAVADRVAGAVARRQRLRLGGWPARRQAGDAGAVRAPCLRLRHRYARGLAVRPASERCAPPSRRRRG